MRLDHVNIHARDQEAVRDFLIALLGLKVGWRPKFEVPGYWLYEGEPATSGPANGTTGAVIHLWPRTSPPGAGWTDHLAFGPYGDADATRQKLKKLGFAFTETPLVDTDIYQFFVTGPEGVKIELQCRRKA